MQALVGIFLILAGFFFVYKDFQDQLNCKLNIPPGKIISTVHYFDHKINGSIDDYILLSLEDSFTNKSQKIKTNKSFEKPNANP